MPDGFLTPRDLDGRTAYYKLLNAAKEGGMNKIKRGVYASDEDLAKQMIDIDKVVHGSVLCLYSAWSYYGLTTQVPQAYCLAIKHGRKIVIPHYPPINLYHWSGKAFSLGITEKVIEGFDVRIYDMEKCVCDAVRYRNKVGFDVCIEVVKEYLNRKDRNVDKLMSYASELRVANVIRPFVDYNLQ